MKTNGSAIYQVKRFDSRQEGWWKDTQAAEIAHFPWGELAEVDYRPVTSARLGTDGQVLFVYMETNETDLRAEARGFAHVHTDSCMEFFLSPDAASTQYFNFEFNPAGAMYLAFGTSRNERAAAGQDNYHEFFQVKTAIHAGGWNLEYCIPLDFLRRYFPSLELKQGLNMRGNFYKCGDETPHPHYGCWSPINLPQPDFHCPEFFGTLIL